jgi:prepilin-type N-terminal cleavage/methylation domain-containing protein
MMHVTHKRAGFTLIEMMVVMALIALLTAMVMLIAPNILDKDRARDAASQLQGALQNARMRAMRDGVPRGVRLIVDPTSTGATFTTASSYQYIEVPPWLLFTNASGATPTSGTAPYLSLSDTLATAPVPITVNGTTTTYPIGSIASTTTPFRTCTIGGLTTGQLSQLTTIVNGTSSSAPTLGLPTINFWTQIVQGSLTQINATSCTIQLAVYPDAMLGAATVWSPPAGFTGPSYFGIYQSPRPLLGEPAIQMPVNTCVDLSNGVSQPSLAQYAQILGAASTSGLQGYDILFSPSGQMMTPAGVGQVYLWVRDPMKGNGTAIPNPNPNGGSFYSMSPYNWSPTGLYTTPQFAAILPLAGEQLLVSIRANSGGTGVSPVFWPTATIPTPYFYAASASNAP